MSNIKSKLDSKMDDFEINLRKRLSSLGKELNIDESTLAKKGILLLSQHK